MGSFKRTTNIVGWLVFAVAAVVYYLSAERTGSLWDCGEFILGAYKLQVVHPPGAPVFLLIGRMFAWIGSIFSSDPSTIAFAVNLMSGICTAFSAMFGAWITMILGKIALVGREEETNAGENIALAGAGLVAGFSAAFCTTMWFSAVEGEVYAMSMFFSAITIWAAVKWYALPNEPQYDRWLIFAIYMAGLSIGVHLLSILTFPALAMFFYYKRYEKTTFTGTVLAALGGVVLVGLLQKLIITGLPNLWAAFELFTVNNVGLPFHSGLIPTLIVLIGFIFIGFRWAHQEDISIVEKVLMVIAAAILFYASFGFISSTLILAAFGYLFLRGNDQKNERTIQTVVMAFALLVLSMSTFGMVVSRANANPPINMNAPKDALSLLPYLNREQYGERPLLRGPSFAATPVNVKAEKRYGRVGDRYEPVAEKIDYVYNDVDKMLFPRMSDPTQGRPALYKQWLGMDPNAELPIGRPNMGDNVSFFWNYQIKWMYWRYFMWNFAGRQNADQGYYSWDKSSGNWLSGISFIDNMRLDNQSALPTKDKNNPARNKYYMIPFILGLLGLVYHANKRSYDFMALLALFVITGIGIIVYSNQPPNEPRERDYVLVGSFFTFCIWIGMAVLAIFELLRDKVKLSSPIGAGLASALALTAPLLMLTQNFDDHSRNGQYGARDYASNFLNSCEKNAIIFTYGDNDTYPLWYAQEVEGIRRDVRVVNLSLIAVDWYIDLLRRKINDSPPLKLTISAAAYQGDKRNQLFFNEQPGAEAYTIQNFLKFIGEDHPLPMNNGNTTESYLPTKNVYIPISRDQAMKNGSITAQDTNVVDRIPLAFDPNTPYLTKDDLAVLDVIGSNIADRPVYFAVTVVPDKLFGMADYMQLEGLALRIVPKRSPSDPNFGVLGSGSVDAEKVYENVTKKWKWGNFDKQKTFVNDSYAPSLQSMQLSMRRAAGQFLAEGKKEKAIAVADQYFKAFPAFNFPYGYTTLYMIDMYTQAGAYDKAIPHLRALAKESVETMNFLRTLKPETVTASYQMQERLASQSIQSILQEAKDSKNAAFLAEMEKLLKPYQTMPTENMLPPN